MFNSAMILEMEIKVIIKDYVYNLWDNFYKSSPTDGGYEFLFSSISAKSTSTSPSIFPLRTGHCRLNKHLHRINLQSSGLCSLCSAPEDVEHVLLYCPRYSNARDVLRFNLTRFTADFSLTSILFDIFEPYLLYFIHSTKIPI